MHLFGPPRAAAGWRQRLAVGLLAGLACASPWAQGGAAPLTLPEAYQAALRYDTQYLIATKELEAARLNVPLARANLLPQVGLSASVSRVMGSREFGNSLNQSVRVPLDYESPQVSLNLRTPLFNYESWSRLKQASSLAEAAEFMMTARHLDLVNRLTAAYLGVLVQYEVMLLSAEDLRSLQSQAEQARQRYTRGEGTIQEATAGEAAAELAKTRLARAEDDLAIARQGLQRITGLETVALRAVPADFAGLTLPLPTLQAWFDHALQHNPVLRFRSLNVDAARHGIERQRAGHLPRLDLVAGMSRAQNDSVSTLNQTTQQRSIGVQLSVPLYSGGAVQAGIAQSVAERDRAEQELRAEREGLLLEVERLFRLAMQGRERLAAHMQALDAAGVAVRAAARAQETGLGTAAEFRSALARQAAARRDLIQARYEYLNQRSQLLVVGGWPMGTVVDDMARVLSVDAMMKETQP